MVKSGLELLQRFYNLFLYSSTLWSCKCPFAKSICSHSDIWKMTECFRQYVSLKKFNFFWKLMLPNLSFRFTIFVINLHRLSGN